MALKDTVPRMDLKNATRWTTHIFLGLIGRAQVLGHRPEACQKSTLTGGATARKAPVAAEVASLNDFGLLILFVQKSTRL